MLVVNGKEVFTTIAELVNPHHTALILIDLQNDYMMFGGYFDKLEDTSALCKIVPNIKRILEEARHRNILIVHVQMTFYPDFLAESPAALRKRLLRIGRKSLDSVESYPLIVSRTLGAGRLLMK